MDKYQVSFGMVFSEQDSFISGCFGDSEVKHLEPAIIIKSATLEGLISKVCSKFNVPRGNILLNSCDEVGRIDVQTYTLKAGQIKNTYDKYRDEFLNGERDLWLNCFTGTCTTIPKEVNFDEVQIK